MGLKGGEKIQNRVLSLALAAVLALSMGLIGCGGGQAPETTEYGLTISSTEGGSVTTPGEGTASFTYDEGTVVDLVAEPEEGYSFVNWTGDVSTIADVNDATTTITMDDDCEITANFEEEGDEEPTPTISISDITQKSTVVGPKYSYQVAISPSGRYVLVGDEIQSVVTFAVSDGTVLWENALTGNNAMESGAISSNGSLIVVGGQRSTVFAFSREGIPLWQADLSGELQVALTDTGERVFAAGHSNLSAYDHDGHVLWSQEISTRGWSIWGISTTPDGTRILLRTNSDILILDGEGQEYAWFDVASDNSLLGASLSCDGKQFAVGFLEEDTNYVALYSVDSGEIWRQAVGDYVDVALDDRGSVFAATQSGDSYVWDNEGNLLANWPSGGRNIAVAGDGQTCIVGDFSQATIYSVKWD